MAHLAAPFAFAAHFPVRKSALQDHFLYSQAWVSKATAMLRSLDPHHLVTVGTDGFFGPSSPGAHSGTQDDDSDLEHSWF